MLRTAVDQFIAALEIPVAAFLLALCGSALVQAQKYLHEKRANELLCRIVDCAGRAAQNSATVLSQLPQGANFEDAKNAEIAAMVSVVQGLYPKTITDLNPASGALEHIASAELHRVILANPALAAQSQQSFGVQKTS
jgi:hypothetical protein